MITSLAASRLGFLCHVPASCFNLPAGFHFFVQTTRSFPAITSFRRSFLFTSSHRSSLPLPQLFNRSPLPSPHAIASPIVCQQPDVRHSVTVKYLFSRLYSSSFNLVAALSHWCSPATSFPSLNDYLGRCAISFAGYLQLFCF
ncbi:hypothetical protein N656DRAFT_91347 [Canariomyces notabilis]|uniref:Uncharacterized protein n=1 Tax=Canariomyces notabilis TaxID=2074819 RepID=A0AAN6TDZ3_9PEZI|nr:hypothetical protein N656DRAFT_91347 [Canariomyces arenarius]